MQNTTEKSSRSAEGLYKFFIYFVLVLLAVTIIVPVAWVFMASIKQNAEFYGNPWALPAGFYWQNFVNAWNGAKMGEYMLNSVIVTALALALLLVVALPAAYCLSRFHFKGCKVLNTLFMAGLFINVNYIVVPIFLMLRDGDVWLKSHFGSGFLLNNLVVLAVVYAATALPFTIYLLSGYFATLPHDFEEAAYIDGANELQILWKVIVPLCKPALATFTLFHAVGHWNGYFNATMYINSRDKWPLMLIVREMVAESGTSMVHQSATAIEDLAQPFTLQMAIIIFTIIPILCVYPFVQKYFMKGMLMGSVKG